MEELAGDRPLASFDTVTFDGLARARVKEQVTVLDVRQNAEWAGGHLESAQHIPLHELPGRVDEVKEGPVWVHCAGGFRATIAASILDAAGKDVTAIIDEFDHAEKAGLTLSSELT